MLSRYLTPALLLVVGAGVWQFNSTHTGKQLIFPLMWLLVDDLYVQGQRTWQMLLIVGSVLLVVAIIDQIRVGRNKPPAEEEPK